MFFGKTVFNTSGIKFGNSKSGKSSLSSSSSSSFYGVLSTFNYEQSVSIVNYR